MSIHCVDAYTRYSSAMRCAPSLDAVLSQTSLIPTSPRPEALT